MSISASIKALLSLSGKKQVDLLGTLGASSKQSLSNKFTNERWSADDLARIAEFVGCELAFVAPDGNKIIITPNEKSPDA